MTPSPNRYLILSDIHANLQALDAVLADAGQVGYDAVICLGDLVGYGGDPSAAFNRTMALSPVAVVRGNHDKVCAGLEPPTFFREAAKQAAEWTHRVLTPDEITRLAALPRGPLIVIDDVLEICHGAPFDEDHYIFGEADAQRAIASVRAPLCLYGHTHVPAVYSTGKTDEETPDLADDEFPLPTSGKTILNVGSVGQPRDHDPRAAYGLLDLGARTMRLRRVEYDIAGAQQRILEGGLPPFFAERLAKGM